MKGYKPGLGHPYPLNWVGTAKGEDFTKKTVEEG
jgi:hypothetical protein